MRQGSLTEAFFYDNLHRLDYSTLGGVTNLDVSYDAMGNLTWRSDVGSYSYHATKKHAVVSAGGVGYGYDAGGQMTTRNGQAISWKSYALPSLINGSALREERRQSCCPRPSTMPRAHSSTGATRGETRSSAPSKLTQRHSWCSGTPRSAFTGRVTCAVRVCAR